MNLTDLCEVFRGSPVGVCCLNDANLDGILESRQLNLFHNERSDKSGDLVTIQQMELVALVEIEVDKAIGITIKTAGPLAGSQDSGQGRRESLGSLHEIGSACTIQYSFSVDGGIYELKGQRIS